LGFDSSGNVTTTDSSGTFTATYAYWDDLQVKSPWHDVRAYGATGDGTTDDSSAIQLAIDAASAEKGVVYLPVGNYSIESSLLFYDPVTFMGAGASAGRFNPDAGTIITWAGNNTTDALIVGGTSSSSREVPTGYNCVQGVTLKNFLLQPDTSGDGRDGILIDASADNDADRGHCRNIVLVDVDVLDFGQYGIRLHGGVYECSFVRVGAKDSGDHSTAPFTCTTASESNITATNPGMIRCYDCLFNGSSDGTKWAAVLWRTQVFGGTVTGASGLYLHSNCGVFGTRFESSAPTSPPASGVAIYLPEKNYQIFTEIIDGFETGIKIGDGTATQARNYWGHVPLIQRCTTGVNVTSGGFRGGFIRVSQFSSCTTDITDSRKFGNATHDAIRVAYPSDTGMGLGYPGAALYEFVPLANEATPSVIDGNIFTTGGTTTITDFDDGVTGQSITIAAAHTVKITDGTNIYLRDRHSWTMKNGDTLTLICQADGEWYETARSHNATSSAMTIVCNENQVVCNENEVVTN